MSTRDRVQNRAERIYSFLLANLGKGYTKPELCKELEIGPGSTTDAAIRRARDLATEAGYHFPPAIKATGFVYMVTNLAADAIDPTLHMSRIEAGVRARKETGIEFMRRERRNVDPSARPVVDMMISAYDAAHSYMSAMQKITDDAMVAIVKLRSDQRKETV